MCSNVYPLQFHSIVDQYHSLNDDGVLRLHKMLTTCACDLSNGTGIEGLGGFK